MKIAFFGTGDFSANILKDLINLSEIEISLIVSGEDKYIGRKKILTKTPVKIIAEANKIKILQYNKLKNNFHFFEELNHLNLDFIIVVAYGKILPKEILKIPKYGCINIHGSILPKYRGASPIQESIKNGDLETGLTIMYMSEGMDEGDILKIKKIKIDILDKTPEIFNKFELIGANLLINTLKGIINGTIKGIIQNNFQATYCSKISKKDGEIFFSTQTGKEIFNKYRAYYPWPGVFTYYKGKKLNIEKCFFDNNFNNNFQIGQVIKINKNEIGIICKNNSLLILQQVKLEGKKSMDIISFVNGNKEFLNYKF